MCKGPAIIMRQVSKMYGRQVALQGIDLEAPRGQILGYIGPNGAGKTTTVKILAGMLPEFSGQVEVCGLDVTQDPYEVKRRVGYVPESPALYDTLTPMEFLAFVGGLHGLDEGVIQTRAEGMFAGLDLADHLHRRMNSFSKGMIQKVVIVSALIHLPELLLLDEPLDGLDVHASMVVREALIELAKDGMTILYCSHDMAMVEKMCDRIAILDQGRIIAQGSMDELCAMSEERSLDRILVGLTRGKKHESIRFIDALRGGSRHPEDGE